MGLGLESLVPKPKFFWVLCLLLLIVALLFKPSKFSFNSYSIMAIQFNSYSIIIFILKFFKATLILIFISKALEHVSQSLSHISENKHTRRKNFYNLYKTPGLG